MQKAGRIALALRQAGVAAESSALPALTRQFATPTEHHETPLSKFMPAVVSAPRKAVTGALYAVCKGLRGTATSGSAKGLVAKFADKVIVGENLVKVEEIDVPFWASLLSCGGYTNAAGFKKFAEAVKPKLVTLAPCEVTKLTVAFHKANYYDQDLFNGIAANVSANFTKYETEQLLDVLAAFKSFNHLPVEALDDIADSITYCNHYLAPVRCSADKIATAFEAYAKAGVERGDLFVTLARGISEISLGKLSASKRKEVVLTTLRAFNNFSFWPENADALLGAAITSPADYSAEELKEVEKFKVVLENAAGGELQVFKEGDDKDAEHWYGHHTTAPGSYQLYVFRDSLVPKEYSPASFRPIKA